MLTTLFRILEGEKQPSISSVLRSCWKVTVENEARWHGKWQRKPDIVSHLISINLVTLTKFIPLCKVTYSQVPGIMTWIFWGSNCSAYYHGFPAYLVFVNSKPLGMKRSQDTMGTPHLCTYPSTQSGPDTLVSQYQCAYFWVMRLWGPNFLLFVYLCFYILYFLTFWYFCNLYYFDHDLKNPVNRNTKNEFMTNLLIFYRKSTNLEINIVFVFDKWSRTLNLINFQKSGHFPIHNLINFSCADNISKLFAKNWRYAESHFFFWKIELSLLRTPNLLSTQKDTEFWVPPAPVMLRKKLEHHRLKQLHPGICRYNVACCRSTAQRVHTCQMWQHKDGACGHCRHRVWWKWAMLWTITEIPSAWSWKKKV
jgi:hypothetical protein